MTTGESAGYFQMGGEGEPDPSFPHVFTTAEDIPFVELSPGLRFRPVFGRSLLFNYVYFDPHTQAPVHNHPEEQMGTVLEGELEFEVAGEKRLMRPGDVWVIPPYVPHGARTFDSACVAIDLFSPPRSGFREMLERVQKDQGL